MNEILLLNGKFTSRIFAVAAALMMFSIPPAGAQTVVRAPGSQVPSPPLPRYVYNVVSADFSAPGGYPLSKSKFNLYDTVGPSRARFDRIIRLMHELNVDTYRLEIGWGRARQGHGMHTAVGGTLDHLTYNFEPMDHIVQELATEGVQFLGSYDYTPFPLQDTNLPSRYGTNNAQRRESTPPKDLAKWKEVITAFVTHHRDAGLPFGVHEVWNEPDGTFNFFSGTEAEYMQLYKATVEAIRAVDPDAIVAGPAADHHLLWNDSFQKFVVANKVPLDALSFHHYSSATLAQRDITKVNESLNRFRELDTTTLSMTEWNTADWAAGSPTPRQRATQLLHDFNLFLNRPELSSVSWTTWEGLMTADGHRRADFNAWKLYARLPVDRRPVAIEGPFEAMAASDAHTASVLIWNNTAFNRRLDVRMEHLPFAKGNVRLYRIDQTHASVDEGTSDELEPVQSFTNIDTTRFEWQDGAVPPFGVLFVEAEDASGKSDLAPANVAKVVRLNRYYPARGSTTSYADFDRKTWIARLGMMDNAEADERIGVLARGLPDVLRVAVKVEGPLRRVNRDSLLGVRVDYRVDGKYEKSVAFHGPCNGVDLFSARQATRLPWNQPSRLDRTIAVPNLGDFQMNLRADAPANWDGTAHITFLMRGAGTGVRAKFTVRPAG